VAIDLIARPSGSESPGQEQQGCLSVVCDAPAPAIKSIAISGAMIRASLEDGTFMEIGELTDSMRLDVERCAICIVIEMNGDAVVASRQVDFR
jgi:hypothetical protein